MDKRGYKTMTLPEFGVKRPVSNLMIFFSIIILAGYSLTRLGVDMMPEIEPPSITIVANYPGASSEDVEIKVTEPLENQLSTTPGIEKISSSSREGYSRISLKFKWDTNIDEASNDIRDRLERAKRFLPDIPSEMDNPSIFKFNTSNIPILYFGITADESYHGLYDLIDKRVCDPLQQLPGVGTVQLMGGLERQINIWVDRERLEGYGFSVIDIKNALKKENITQPVGSIKSGLTDYLLRLPGEFKSPEEINLVILGKREGKFVYLRDVARVEDGFVEIESDVRIDRKRGIMMMVQRQAGTNSVEVAGLVKKRLARLEGALPADVKILTIFDTSHDIVVAIKDLSTTLMAGIFFVILVVWFFLRQIKASFIIALTIPFSLLISFIYLFLAGKTINIISLSSLAIASGMVVDNAIVIVDNAYRHLERGQRPQEAAIFGAQEMFLSVGASTLTTVVVFLPMLFIPGVVGVIFGELAVVITVTLIASLFTATTFSPMLCAMWLRVGNGEQKSEVRSQKSEVRGQRVWLRKFYGVSERFFTKLENRYAEALGWALGHKKVVIFGFTAVFILSLFMTRFVGNEFMPEEDTGDMRITLELALGTRFEETDIISYRVEDILKRDVPEAKFVYVRSGTKSRGMGRAFGGTSGTHVITCGAKLVPKDERKRSVFEVAQALRKEFAAIPGILKTSVSVGNPIGRLISGMGGKAIQIEIVGHSFEDTDMLANKIKKMMESISGAVDVSISRDISRPEFRIEVDREKAAVLGIDMSTIADSLKTFIEGSSATKYREKGETYDILVRLEEESRSKLEDISALSIVSPVTGSHVKLSTIAKVVEGAGPVEIDRMNRERVVTVQCDAYKRSAGKIVEDIKEGLKKIVIPMDIMVNVGGEAEEQAKAFKDLALLLIMGVILVYMVMAAQFESLIDPFVVMFALPFTFTGVIWAFVITRTSLSITSFLGIIMLMGIVVNNAIVLISYINILRARGLSMLESVTLGGKQRLRPVLMTTITTLAGLMPLALARGEGSETWNPLGITIIGGLSVSTVITMIFVPTLYAAVEARLKKRVRSQ